MSLGEIALATEDIGGGFIKFIPQVAVEYAADIATVISELFAISAALRTLAAQHTNVANRPYLPRIQHDLQLVAQVSLRHTLRDVLEAFARMSAAGQSVESYQQTWQLLWNFFYYQSGYTLSVRLQYYKQMLEEMKRIVKGEIPDEALLAKNRQTISALRVIQDKRHAEQLSQQQPPPPMPHPHPNPPQRPHPHPHQHSHQHSHQHGHPAAPPPGFSTPPAPAPPPPQPVPGDPTHTPRKSKKKSSRKVHDMAQRSGSFERERPSAADSMPATPSGSDGAPLSPFSGLNSPTTETTSVSSSSSYRTHGIRHWCVKVFAVELTSLTELIMSGDPTRCYGRSMPDAKERCDAEYDNLFQLDFPGKPQVSLIFYLRDRDHKTRILCRVRSSKTRIVYSTIPITMLEVVREGSCLQLCQRDDENDLVPFVGLQFSSIERMVLFHCTFLALRGQDGSFPVTKIKDDELGGELLLFGGQIMDDDFLHALRIYRDQETNAVRLQASVHAGELERVPVWTAFIHQYFKQKGWLRRTGPKTVQLAQLQIFTFIDSDEYTPPVNRRGDHVITFTTDADADAFVTQMRRLIQFYRGKTTKG